MCNVGQMFIRLPFCSEEEEKEAASRRGTGRRIQQCCSGGNTKLYHPVLYKYYVTYVGTRNDHTKKEEEKASSRR